MKFGKTKQRRANQSHRVVPSIGLQSATLVLITPAIYIAVYAYTEHLKGLAVVAVHTTVPP